MKNLITFILQCLSVTALLAQATHGDTRFSVVSHQDDETVLQLSVTGIDRIPVMTPQGPAYVIGLGEGGTPLLREGAPDVAKYAVALAIPAAGAMAVEVVASTYEEIPDISVAPSKGDLKRTVDPNTVPFVYGAPYETDAFFPGPLAELKHPFVLRDLRGQALWIYPVQYNPVTRTLRIYKELTLRVHATGEAGENEMTPRADRPASRTFEQLYRKTFVNYDPKGEIRGPSTPEKMLVIADDDYLDALAPFVDWKRQMGIETTVVPVSEVGSSDDAAIFNFVKAYYQDHGITYLLLAGDENAINPQMRQDGNSFACDNCFGYLDGDDHLPEVLVGRFNAATVEQLTLMVNRNLEFEKTPLVDTLQNWCTAGMAATSDQGAGIGDDGQADYEQGNEWKTKLLADGFDQYWEFYEGNHADISPTPGDPTADKAGAPDTQDLLQVMNGRGISIFNYTGHGWEQGLASGNFDVTAAAQLHNTGRYPFVLIVGCCAGNFTNNAGGDCLGEALQRAGNINTGEPWGAIASFMSSDYQSWAPPMEGQDGMNQYLIDADGIHLRPNYGAMMAVGNTAMIAAYGSDGELMADFWNIFGDPTTLPRTALPKPVSATHADSLALGSTSLEVQCPVEGALIALYWQGQTLAAAAVESGVAHLNFPPLAGIGPLVVTATQFNGIPFQDTIEVFSTTPFVLSQTVKLDDSAGNNDQQADFGEAILMNVTLASVGIGTATGIHATLSTVDDNVVITDAEEDYGDLEESLTLDKPGAFAFTVNDDVEDGYVLLFNLHLTFNDSMSFDQDIPLVLHAPALAVGTLIIDDVAGGNGNHRLESGESALLYILTKNIGHSRSLEAIATLVANTPYLSLNGPVSLGQLDAVSGEVQATFPVQVSASAPKAVWFNLDYQVKSGNYQAEKTFWPLVINPIIENFETGNFNTFPWAMSGDKPWQISFNLPYEGADCSRAGTITHNQQSRMSITLNVLEDSYVSFARRVGCEKDYDFLRFYIDLDPVGAWSGTLPWEEVLFPVSAGVHTLTWSYEKDGLGSTSPDRAWVDHILLPAHEIVVGTQAPVTTGSFDLQVLPNPMAGQARIWLELPQRQSISIVIFDFMGRPVKTLESNLRQEAGQQTLPLDLSDLPAGVYLVQVLGETGAQTVKVVKD